jgi:aminopeptidase-like protein
MSHDGIINKILNDLFPINRSLTGDGNEETLNYLNSINAQLELKYKSSGDQVFDWTVPDEWWINDAYVKNKNGERIIDFKKNNLHVVGYSKPVHFSSMAETVLRKKIFTSNKSDTVIPYRTSYYKKDWGFCCAESLLKSEKFDGPFEVCIDSGFKENGRLIWGERVFEGLREQEFILTTYICHPSLANDNLSGIVTTYLILQKLDKLPQTKYTYRFGFFPETIGALCFLHEHPDVGRIIGGTIVTNTAGPGKFTIKESFDNTHFTNWVLKEICKRRLSDFDIVTFTPDGSDERQFSKPGFRINTPSLHKSKYYDYWQYHTSADNLDILDYDAINLISDIYVEWIQLVDTLSTPKFVEDRGELQLGKRGLYPQLGGSLNQADSESEVEYQIEMLSWMMHEFDGTMTNFEFAQLHGYDIFKVNNLIKVLMQKGALTYD